MTSPQTCIVIGGGPAGLLAAAHLADAGVQTTLLEAGACFGGRAASQRRAGFDLNLGPHALFARGAGMRELRAVGVDPPRWNPTSPRSVFLSKGKPRRAPGATAALTRWLASVMRGPVADLHAISVNEWLERSMTSAAARDSAAALVRVTTYVADHEQLSADVAAHQVRTGLRSGVRYVKGGWQWLVDALAGEARRRGAHLRTRASARALDGDGAGGWSVALEDEALHADAVIVATGSPARTARLLGERTPAAPGPAAEVSSLDLGLERLPRGGRRFALGIDQPTYLSRHSPPEHRGGELITVASYTRQPLAELEAVADAVQPGWREVLTLHRHLPRMTAVSAIATPQTGGLAGRPGVTVAPGLHVAGDWIGPEGWLTDASLASAAAAARAVAGTRTGAVVPV